MEISVLMSVHKKEKPEYLIESIESIINQTLMPKQIVIIKDGALSEELDDIVNIYKSKYYNLIDIYEIKESLGLGNALRFGIEKCKCEYIARMDADDVAPLYRFEKQVEVFDKNKELDILGGYIEEYDENMKSLESIRKVPLTLEEIKTYIKKQCPFNHGTVIMKKEAVIKSGNYSDVALEDYDLWARMLISGCNMQNMDIILGKNRAGKSLYKRRGGIKRIKKQIEIENRLLSYKIIDIPMYIKNVIFRISVSILPISIRKKIYIKIIRKIA